MPHPDGRRHTLADLYHERTDFDFLHRMWRWALISGIALAIGLISFFARGGLNFGIDFTGGTAFQVTVTNTSPNAGAIRDAVSAAGAPDAKIVIVGGKTVRVQTKDLTSSEQDKVRAAIADYAGVRVATVSVTDVSPTCGDQVSGKAWRALLIFFVVITLYLLANSTYLALLGIPELEAIDKSQSSIAAVEAIRSFGGSTGALLISLLILVTTLSSTHATILSSCRIIYAMAREKLFFAPAAKLNKHDVPANAMIYQCIWGIILVLSGSFDQLTDMCIFAVYFFYGSTALGVFVLRRKMPDAHRPYKVWLYPIVPAIVVIFSGTLFINTFFARPREAAIGLFLMLTSIPMYLFFNRKYRIA